MIYTKQIEDDIVHTFVNKLEQNIKEIYKIHSKTPMKSTNEQQIAFKNVTVCWICQEKLVRDKNYEDYEKLRPVRDYCHFTGEFRGLAHNSCNIKYIESQNLLLFYSITFYKEPR